MSKILTQSLIGDSTISFVAAPFISVPNTTIVNRAPIRDLANDMGARMGVERIAIQGIIELQNEFGANGERVFKALNDDRELIRFVGGKWTTLTNANGTFHVTNNPGDFVEITFYGTGLNWLSLGQPTTTTVFYSLDGGADSSNIYFGSTASNILTGRNYAPYQIIPVVSGLSVGLHTIKLKLNTFDGGVQMAVQGFEILNESSTLRVNAGSLVKDQKKVSLASALTQAYKPTALTGTKGGRVVVYNSGGQIQTAVQAVSATASTTYANVDHSNEEVIRVYSPHEFGAGRSANDDWSLNHGNAAAFTLDDGTTGLVGTSGGFTVFNKAEGWTITVGAANFLTFTFVGTGLDVGLETDSSRQFSDITIDGVTALGNYTKTTIYPENKKICSGLPYGTHTVRFKPLSAGGSTPSITKFIVYGPKKPTIPSGAVELADYNVMADYVPNATAGLETIGTGTLRKQTSREVTYVGTWIGATTADVDKVGGQSTYTGTSGAYAEYTFFGSGFELRFLSKSDRTTNVNIKLQNLSLSGSLLDATVANFPTQVTSVYGTGVTFSAPTLDMQDGSQTNGAGFRLSGLPLSLWKVRITNNAAATMDIQAFDIITPIHAPKSNLLADLQNTLPVGSCSLSDSRQYVASNQNPQKAWAQAVGMSGSTSSTSETPMVGMSVTIKTSGGRLRMQAAVTTYDNTAGQGVNIRFYLNGSPVGTQVQNANGSANTVTGTANVVSVQVPAGVHKVDLYWSVTAGTVSTNANPIMLVEEV